jgi:hypothetical protein
VPHYTVPNVILYSLAAFFSTLDLLRPLLETVFVLVAVVTLLLGADQRGQRHHQTARTATATAPTAP